MIKNVKNIDNMQKTKINIIKNAFLSSLAVVEEMIEEIESVFTKEERIFLKYIRTLDKKDVELKIMEIKKNTDGFKRETWYKGRKNYR